MSQKLDCASISISHYDYLEEDILDYISLNILPKYSDFDKGHNLEHVNSVIVNSVELANDYNVNKNMVYIIAAYHDIGLTKGRKKHHIYSADYLKEDNILKKWFNSSEINLMAEAIEDHRASNSYPPRSIYGKIIAEADRDLDFETVMSRVIDFRLANIELCDFKNSFDDVFEDSYNHLQEKYGKNGYLKLFLNYDKNRLGLEKIRVAISNKKEFRLLFKKIYFEKINDINL